MKNLKIFALIAAVVVSVMSVDAQGRAPKQGPKSPKQMTERLNKKLTLTADQQKKVESIFADYQDDMKDAKEDRKEARDEMKKQNAELDNDLKSVLSSEQYAEYQAMKAKKQDGKKRGGKKAPKKGQRR